MPDRRQGETSHWRQGIKLSGRNTLWQKRGIPAPVFQGISFMRVDRRPQTPREPGSHPAPEHHDQPVANRSTATSGSKDISPAAANGDGRNKEYWTASPRGWKFPNGNIIFG